MPEEFEVTEIKEPLKPFTLEEAQEAEKACIVCEYVNTCPIILYVNKLSAKRDGKEVTDEFNCVIFNAETEAETVEV